MQNGAMPHRTSDVMDYLYENFPGRVIGLGYNKRYGCGIDWLPYSPDLNPCDSYLWGELKDCVYRTAPEDLADLKLSFTEQIKKMQVSEIKQQFWPSEIEASQSSKTMVDI